MAGVGTRPYADLEEVDEMTVAQQTPPAAGQQVSSGMPPPNGRWSGFRHLLKARLLELKREREVIFWAFGFPVLLAIGLGIAFGNKSADIAPVAIVDGTGAADAVTLLKHSPQNSSLRPSVMAEAAALQGFRLGKYDLVVVPDGKGAFQYRYDPARPESVLARAEVDDAPANGGWPQESVVDDRVRIQRARIALYRLPDPRPAGNEPHEFGHVGPGIRSGRHAPAQTAQAFRRNAHAPQ